MVVIDSRKQKSQHEAYQERYRRIRQDVEPSEPDVIELRQELHGSSEKTVEGHAYDASRNEKNNERSDNYQKLQTFPDYDAYQQAYDERQNDRDYPSNFRRD
jgi:hypothetical protein